LIEIHQNYAPKSQEKNGKSAQKKHMSDIQ